MSGESKMNDPFEKVSTFSDFLAANLAFLNGEVDQTPYHSSPVDEETIELLPG